MLRALVKRNSKRLKTLSVYKPIFICLLLLYFRNLYILLFGLLYLLFDNKNQIPVFVLFLFITFFSYQYRSDFIPIGIVEYKTGSFYTVDKFLYKTKIFSDELKPGDILYFRYKGTVNSTESQINRNILYINDDYLKISSFSLRNNIYEYINTRNEDIKPFLLKFFYNISSDDSVEYALGYGLISYYFFSLLIRKNRLLGILTLLIYSLLFGFQNKFYLLILTCLLDCTDLTFIDKLAMKTFILLMINRNFIYNYSILISLLISSYRLFTDYLSFNTYFSIINLYLFHELNPVRSYFYRTLIKFQILLFSFSLVYLIFPFIYPVYKQLLMIYSYINSVNISIRGDIGILGIIILIYLYKRFNLSNILMYLFLCLMAVSQLNNPFMHVTFIDVGQGNATLIRNPLNGSCVLIDTGSVFNYTKLKSYLYSESIYTIDYLIISHDDSDHNGNIENINKDFNVKRIITEPEDIEEAYIKLKSLYAGEYDNDNDNSLIYLLNIDNYNILFDGDISSNVERDLINSYGKLDIDILLASHHGSYTGNSDYFIRNTFPRYAIISTSGMYNHPSDKTLKTFDNYKVRYFITKDTGNIRYDFTSLIDFITLSKRGFVIMIGK